MFVTQEMYEVEAEIRAEEARKLRLEREAMRASRGESRGRPWRWRVEPGMEGVFGSLLGWFLPAQRGERAEGEPGLEEHAEGRPETVAVRIEESEWALPPLPYFGWSCYA